MDYLFSNLKIKKKWKQYVIKFEHVEESTYTAVVEANSYKEAMDIFEESPFDYLEKEEPDNVQGLTYHVS